MANVLDVLANLSPAGLIGSLGGKLIETIASFFPNPEKKAEAAQALAMAQMQGVFKEEADQISLLLQQAQINLEEAKSEKWWVAGWRPFIGWICGCAFAYAYVLQPFMQFVSVTFFHNQINISLLPKLDTADILPVLLGMLGLGGLRTYEKVQGANTTKSGG